MEANKDVDTAVIYKGYYCEINGKVYAAPTAEELVKALGLPVVPVELKQSSAKEIIAAIADHEKVISRMDPVAQKLISEYDAAVAAKAAKK